MLYSDALRVVHGHAPAANDQHSRDGAPKLQGVLVTDELDRLDVTMTGHSTVIVNGKHGRCAQPTAKVNFAACDINHSDVCVAADDQEGTEVELAVEDFAGAQLLRNNANYGSDAASQPERFFDSPCIEPQLLARQRFGDDDQRVGIWRCPERQRTETLDGYRERNDFDRHPHP